MQIDTSNTVAVTNTLTTPSTVMTMDPDGMAHLIAVLTNLYADKHLAVLREYSTNALDAHVAADNDAPIEVTLPTALNPTLVITDHGIGLSREEIVGVYSRYGASTKRGTDTQIGSFGLGAKSAFTIGGQFIVTATKDGRRTAAVFALDEHGVGSVSILAEHDTTDGNGVTISIAVEDPSQMHDAAEKFFRAWRPGTVLVDGREPASYFTQDGALWLGEDVLYTGQSCITVVMGSVAYPLPASAVTEVRTRTGGQWHEWDGRPGLVVFVPIGAVDITPSREAVRDTERTISAVSAVLADLPARFARALDAVTEAAPSTVDMIMNARPYLKAAEQASVPVRDMMPANIDAPDAVTYGLTRRGALYSEPLDKVSYSLLSGLTVLVGVPAKRQAKRQTKQWLNENPRRTLIQFGDGNATSGRVGWLTWGGDSPVRTVHFDDIELPPRETGGSRAVTYRVLPSALSRHSHAMSLADLRAQTRPVAYLPPGHSMPAYAADAVDGYLLIELTVQQSTDVLLRRVPSVVPVSGLIQEWTRRQLAEVGELSELVASMYAAETVDRIHHRLDGERVNRLTHPTFLALANRAAAYRDLSTDLQILIRRHGSTSDVAEETVTAAMDRDLPLLMHAVTGYYGYPSNAVLDHLVLYVNSAPVGVDA